MTFSELYRRALEKNPKFTNALMATYMQGGISTQQFENALNQRLEAKAWNRRVSE